jgi:putative hydroxymethylpyrimidine transport system substrate-binding protein
LEENRVKKALFVFITFAVIFTMAGCGQNDTSGKKELAEIDLMLDWYPNAVHSYLYVAIEKGYFEDEGIKLNIQFPTNPTDPINLAAAGQITLGISYQPDVVIARANQDVPVKAVAAIVRSPLNHVVLLADSPIQTPKDLEGKTIGFPGIPLNEALLKTMVKTDGGNPDNVTMIDVGFELGSSIVSGRVDGVIGAYINHEVPVLKHKGYETRFFNPVDYGVPSFYELVLVTNDKTWNEREEDIKAFWRAATKGYEFMKANPDEALTILLNNQDKANFALIEEVEKQSLEILLPKMESAEGFGSQDASSWQETIDWMVEFDLIKKEPALEEIFINIDE